MYRANDKSAAVKEIKKYLYALNQSLYPSIRRTTIDGFFDDETRNAVIDFQKIMGINPTGIVNLETFNALYAEYLRATDESNENSINQSFGIPIAIGDMTEDVRVLHVLINKLSRIYNSVDYVGTSAYYSEESANAVRALKKIFMMEDTPIVDKATMQRILYDLKNNPKVF